MSRFVLIGSESMFANYENKSNVPSNSRTSFYKSFFGNFSAKNLNSGHPKTSSTLKTMENFDNHLAEKTQNDYDPIKRKIIEDFLKEVIDQNELCMACPGDIDIVSSIKREHFKNMFENGVGTEDAKELRKNISKTLFGWKDTPKDEEFEKYGFISNKGELSYNDTTLDYGPIKYIFDKKRVAGRTTFVIGDSIENRSHGVQASRVTNPKIESIPGVVNKDYTGVAELYEMMWDSHDYILENPSYLSRALPDKPYFTTYVEAQFHGKLTLDDVKSVLVRPNNLISVDDIKSALSDTHLNGKVESI